MVQHGQLDVSTGTGFGAGGSAVFVALPHAPPALALPTVTVTGVAGTVTDARSRGDTGSVRPPVSNAACTPRSVHMPPLALAAARASALSCATPQLAVCVCGRHVIIIVT